MQGYLFIRNDMLHNSILDLHHSHILIFTRKPPQIEAVFHYSHIETYYYTEKSSQKLFSS